MEFLIYVMGKVNSLKNKFSGLARKEDFPHITYYCPHCNALNASNQSEVRLPSPSARDPETSVVEAQAAVIATDSKVVQTPVTGTDTKVVSSIPVVQDLPEKDAPKENKEKQEINEQEES